MFLTNDDLFNLEHYESLESDQLMEFIEALHLVDQGLLIIEAIDQAYDAEAIQTTIRLLRDILTDRNFIH